MSAWFRMVLASLMAVAALQALACNPKTGERVQRVFLGSAGQSLDAWDVTSNAIHEVQLANGFRLGVKIEPLTAEKRAELAKAVKYLPEMVEISLFDLSADSPKLIAHTFGGANSVQGYGPRGGADRVDELGAAGIELLLFKAVCVAALDTKQDP